VAIKVKIQIGECQGKRPLLYAPAALAMMHLV
jgi:hypothetical protein